MDSLKPNERKTKRVSADAPSATAKAPKKRKCTAKVVCQNQKRFWTTQRQFWQWVRSGTLRKTSDHPLTGEFVRENEELMVIVGNTVLNLAHPNHLREALASRRLGLAKKTS